MTETKIKNNLKWIHLTRPNKNDVNELKNEFNIHPLILDELLSPSDRSKIETYDDYLFLVYHLPIYNNLEQTSRRAEIDFVATKEILITVTYEEIEPINQFERDLEKKYQNTINNAAQIVYYILEEVNDFSLRQLKHVERKVNFVGDQIFKRQDRKLLEDISSIKRDLLDFAIIAVPQKSTLTSLSDIGVNFWGKHAAIYFADLEGDFLKIHLLLENLKATVESYSQTVSQLFEFKTSEIIRRFSILGFLTFPLVLYATIALQPQVEATFIKEPADFWIYFFVISAILLGVAAFFRKRGWL
ncbi:MAG: CorA family divalent cation transporter [Patescibacteria group bacterium]|nr:CorA family divalent cation transporter [Patescibacteria group bacterium]